METESIKLKDEELKTIQDIRDRYAKVVDRFGQLKISEIQLQREMDAIAKYEAELTDEFNAIRDDEEKFTEHMSTTYGPGELEIETGRFTPIKVTEPTV